MWMTWFGNSAQLYCPTLLKRKQVTKIIYFFVNEYVNYCIGCYFREFRESEPREISTSIYVYL